MLALIALVGPLTGGLHAEPSDARELFERVRAQYRDAKALHLVGKLKSTSHTAEGANCEREASFELRAMKPGSGVLEVHESSSGCDVPAGAGQPANWRVAANGVHAYDLDLDAKTFVELDCDLELLICEFDFPPFSDWADAQWSLGQDRVRGLPDQPAHPNWRGLHFGYTANGFDLWIDERDRVVRAVRVSGLRDDDPLRVRREYDFEVDELFTEAKSSDYSAEPPADFQHAKPAPPSTAPDADAARVPLGSEAPTVELATLDGRALHSREFAGMTVVYEFWSARSYASLAEMSELERLWRELSSRRDDLVFVCVDFNDSNDELRRRWARGHFSMLSTTQEFARVSRAFGVHTYPSYVLVSPAGKLVSRAGASHLEELNRAIDAIACTPRNDAERAEFERRSEARDRLHEVWERVQRYVIAHGHMPESLEDLTRPDADGKQRALLDEIPLDPWNHPYVMTHDLDGTTHLYCFGRDGARGGFGVDADIDARWL